MFLLSIFLVLILLVGAMGLAGRKKLASESASKESATLPDRLPVMVKRPFFSRSEQAFFAVLGEALQDTPYTVFPNVRLNDLFKITDPEQRQSTYNRLRDKHVDFLIVTRDRYLPTLAIELDGESHSSAVQQERDRVKDLIFHSAGLGLLRLDARQIYQVSYLRDRLSDRLTGLPADQDAAIHPNVSLQKLR
ncbi:DUF2726 domain-containing protein [Deinococcus ruber]|uniref:DUF2726 domain-containing protein n=1 Tax=Deinococcus ruber TaxID=1848197 RepID=A0A918C3Q9_9DEIO|nr:DUF2726 domain-containing protein [Deinococcus ruber]GGR05356.1 hypothetical protein GCM10008957_17870 [Deinococcus ruber]